MYELPKSLADLYEFLFSSGFTVVHEQRGGMAGLDLVLGGSVPGRAGEVPTYVNISSDRDHWALAVKFGGMARWITAGAWEAYLDGVPMEGRSLEQQTFLVERRIHEMAEAFRRGKDIEPRLVRIGEDYMRGQLGI